ncbi:SRPBCC domain-containing protein [Streptomyces sp. NPDC051940]|uniref:SRPBCC domain-containing protein n=1 Tax=Streptomyces sp. NPDC051940 TaxID=3155675 RepID=UPI003443AB0A
MEQEVYVPYPVATVRRALTDPARVARCIPGLQLDAGGDSLQGRLRLRIAGSTITYRGGLRIHPQGDGVAVEGEGTEARGTGTVKLTLALTPRPTDGGTALGCAGTVLSEGRLAAVDPGQAQAAAVRLLERFAESLGASLEANPPADEPGAAPEPETAVEPEAAPEPEAPVGPEAGSEPEAAGPEAPEWPEAAPDDNERVIPGIPAPDRPRPDAAAEEQPEQGGPDDESASVFETEVPPPSLDPLADDLTEEEDTGPEVIEEIEDVTDLDDEPEAAHARRTMIGRSTEEVDHAPPRGRYAPEPAAETGSGVARLRWAAPVAAFAVATAVVVVRRLRRR